MSILCFRWHTQKYPTVMWSKGLNGNKRLDIFSYNLARNFYNVNLMRLRLRLGQGWVKLHYGTGGEFWPSLLCGLVRANKIKGKVFSKQSHNSVWYNTNSVSRNLKIRQQQSLFSLNFNFFCRSLRARRLLVLFRVVERPLSDVGLLHCQHLPSFIVVSDRASLPRHVYTDRIGWTSDARENRQTTNQLKGEFPEEISKNP